MNTNKKPISTKNQLSIARLTLVIALMMITSSLSGIFFHDLVYPDPNMVETFLPNDYVNLIIGIPYFVVVLGLLKKEKISGLLLLPGALIYVLYNYIAYLVGLPLSIVTALNLGLVFLSGYTLITILSNIDHSDIKSRLAGIIPRKISIWVLILIGGAFFLFACYKNINAIITGIPLPLGEQVSSMADLVVSSLWIGGGILLLLDKGLGYTAGLGLLIAASSLFVGLILFFIIGPFVTNQPFDLIAVITVLLMGVVCFIPSGLYLRGVIIGGE